MHNKSNNLNIKEVCNKLDNINKKQIDLGETAELFLNLKELEQEEVKIKTKLTNKTKKNKPKKKIHTVKGNDTLRSIAKKYYGSGSYANKIYNANKTVIEKAAKKHGRVSSAHNGVNGWYIYDGTKLVIP